MACMCFTAIKIVREKSFGKLVFSFFGGNFDFSSLKLGFGGHFVNVFPIFDILYYFTSFGLLYQWCAFQPKIHSGNYFSELGSLGTSLDY